MTTHSRLATRVICLSKHFMILGKPVAWIQSYKSTEIETIHSDSIDMILKNSIENIEPLTEHNFVGH